MVSRHAELHNWYKYFFGKKQKNLEVGSLHVNPLKNFRLHPEEIGVKPRLVTFFTSSVGVWCAKGPIVFNLYVDSLINLLPRETVTFYANDTATIVKGHTWNELFKNEHCINLLKLWLDSSILTLNVYKKKNLLVPQ